MIPKKHLYLFLLPILAVFFFASQPEHLSEFDRDDLDFSESTERPLAESQANTLPASEGAPSAGAEVLAVSGLIDEAVPFLSQAPLAEWGDPRQQDGCEEASVIMAMAWAGKENFDSPSQGRERILALSAWQEENFGTYVDSSAEDTLGWLIRGYYRHERADLIKDAGLDDIKDALWRGGLVLAPCDGRSLGNPNFTPPGPERHMLLVRGYDEARQEFIANDPGTRKGEAYRYGEKILYGAIRDYPSGDRAPIAANEKNVIVIMQ